MTRTITGKVAEQLTVNDELTVQGALAAPAVVTDGGSLVLYGAAGSPITVQAGGRLTVAGALACTVTVEAGGFAALTGALVGQVVNHGTVINDLIDENGRAAQVEGPGETRTVDDLSEASRTEFLKMRPQTKISFD